MLSLAFMPLCTNSINKGRKPESPRPYMRYPKAYIRYQRPPPAWRGLFAAALLSILATTAQSEPLAGRIVGVHDGDTLRVNREGKSLRVRLYGVDCPELKQAGGTEARALSRRLTHGRVLLIESKGTDRYKRIIGRVFLLSGNTLSSELVKAGRCWWYKRYAPKDKALAGLEAEARADKRGLWADPDPVPPWEWRKQRRRQ